MQVSGDWSVRGTNKDITGARGITFPSVGGCFEGREGGIPDPKRECPSDAGDETAVPDKSVVLSAGLGPKGRGVKRGDLEYSQFGVSWEWSACV